MSLPASQSTIRATLRSCKLCGIASFLPMTYLRKMFIFRYFNISAKVANSLPAMYTLCPINWVETRNDAPVKFLVSFASGFNNCLKRHYLFTTSFNVPVFPEEVILQIYTPFVNFPTDRRTW